MTVVTAAATLAPACEAKTGFYPGEFSTLPLWCAARIGLTVWTDSRGQTHRACRHHVAGLQSRYPAQARPGAASAGCESGGRDGCTCDVCF